MPSRESFLFQRTGADFMGAFWTFITTDWYFAIPLFFMSGVAVTLVIWRLLLNNSAKTNMNEFLPRFQEELEKKGIDAALRYCRSQTGMIPRKLYVAGLETARQGLAAMRRSMANVIELEILPDLNFLLPPILAIAKIATMVGLLGTVISMINTFNDIQKTKGGAVSEQAGAIGLAKFEVRMKSAAQKLMVLLQSKPTSKGAGAGPATPASGVRPGIDPSAISP